MCFKVPTEFSQSDFSHKVTNRQHGKTTCRQSWLLPLSWLPQQHCELGVLPPNCSRRSTVLLGEERNFPESLEVTLATTLPCFSLCIVQDQGYDFVCFTKPQREKQKWNI